MTFMGLKKNSLVIIKKCGRIYTHIYFSQIYIILVKPSGVKLFSKMCSESSVSLLVLASVSPSHL